MLHLQFNIYMGKHKWVLILAVAVFKLFKTVFITQEPKGYQKHCLLGLSIFL